MTLHLPSSKNLIPIYTLKKEKFKPWLEQQSTFTQNWVEHSGLSLQEKSCFLLPAPDGRILAGIFILSQKPSLWDFSSLPSLLPHIYTYDFVDFPKELCSFEAALGIELASYSFSRFKTASSHSLSSFTYQFKSPFDQKLLTAMVESIFWIRDLINTPASHMGPEEISTVASAFANETNGTYKLLVGEELIHYNYPAIYTVGKGSSRAPRVIDITWGNPNHPKLTLVGKGVCFDSGGLDLKSSSNMLLMKKDMGGAAHALGLAKILIAMKCPLRLRVLIGACDNAVSGNAMRPLDVTQTRKGLTVEIGNTDAEGRLVLADLLTEANSEDPDLIVDFATLTGAARAALGPDIPALFTNRETFVSELIKTSQTEEDPLWPLPLWEGYRSYLNSKIADLNNVGTSSYAGAITAALFLQNFIESQTPWIHLDMMAWNPSSRPGRPEGGEAMTIRTLYKFLTEHFLKKNFLKKENRMPK